MDELKKLHEKVEALEREIRLFREMEKIGEIGIRGS